MLVPPARQLQHCHSPGPLPSGATQRRRLCTAHCAGSTLDEVLAYDFGVVNKEQRKALLKQRSIVGEDPRRLSERLQFICTMLGTTQDDFSCCISCASSAVVGALLELSTAELAQRIASIRAILPPEGNCGKIVAAAPQLILRPNAGAEVESALAAIRLRAGNADFGQMCVERPGSFGLMIGQVVDAGGSLLGLTPLMHAWLQGLR